MTDDEIDRFVDAAARELWFAVAGAGSRLSLGGLAPQVIQGSVPDSLRRLIQAHASLVREVETLKKEKEDLCFRLSGPSTDHSSEQKG